MEGLAGGLRPGSGRGGGRVLRARQGGKEGVSAQSECSTMRGGGASTEALPPAERQRETAKRRGGGREGERRGKGKRRTLNLDALVRHLGLGRVALVLRDAHLVVAEGPVVCLGERGDVWLGVGWSGVGVECELREQEAHRGREGRRDAPSVPRNATSVSFLTLLKHLSTSRATSSLTRPSHPVALAFNPSINPLTCSSFPSSLPLAAGGASLLTRVQNARNLRAWSRVERTLRRCTVSNSPLGSLGPPPLAAAGASSSSSSSSLSSSSRGAGGSAAPTANESERSERQRVKSGLKGAWVSERKRAERDAEGERIEGLNWLLSGVAGRVGGAPRQRPGAREGRGERGGDGLELEQGEVGVQVVRALAQLLLQVVLEQVAVCSAVHGCSVVA